MLPWFVSSLHTAVEQNWISSQKPYTACHDMYYNHYGELSYINLEITGGPRHHRAVTDLSIVYLYLI